MSRRADLHAEEQAREAGAAEALGRPRGRQPLDADDRAEALEQLFDPRGRKHQRLRPLIEAASTSAAPPVKEARLVSVNGGEQGHVEL